MKLVSIDTIPGVEYEILGIVKGTIVQSKNIGRDFMAGMKSIAAPALCWPPGHSGDEGRPRALRPGACSVLSWVL